MKKVYRLIWASLGASLLAGCGSLEWDGSSIFGNPLSNNSSSNAAPTQTYAPLPPATADTKYAVVNHGETVSQVAARYGVDANALAAANNISPFAGLTQGQYLRLPINASDATQAVEAAQTQAEEELQTVKEQAATSVASNTTTAQTAAPAQVVEEKTTKKGYVWPTQGQVTTNYSANSSGLTISAPRSAPVVAAKEGEVVHSGNVSGYGNTIIVKHPDGMVSVYGYNDSLLVKKGDRVGKGQVISRVGSSGSATSPSLRFELRKGKTPVNPNEYLGQ